MSGTLPATEPSATPAVSPADVCAADVCHEADEAYRRIGRFVRVTPLERVPLPGSRAARLLVKAEHLQHTGSFKIRGALAAVSRLTPAQRAAGVVTASSGNHGLGVAYALSVYGGHGTVFVPDHASPTKVDAIERLGTRVRRAGPDGLEAELAARDEARRLGQAYISPYNDLAVISGQAGIGLEIAWQLGAEPLAAVVVAVGGGGLISGVAAVLRKRFPGVLVIGASPANDAAMAASVAAGHVVDVPATPTLSDGTAGGLESDAITLPLCRDLVDRWLLIPEDDIAATMRDYLGVAHQVVEGAAAVALAAAKTLDADSLGIQGNVVVVSCGANVSTEDLRRVLA